MQWLDELRGQRQWNRIKKKFAGELIRLKRLERTLQAWDKQKVRNLISETLVRCNSVTNADEFLDVVAWFAVEGERVLVEISEE